MLLKCGRNGGDGRLTQFRLAFGGVGPPKGRRAGVGWLLVVGAAGGIASTHGAVNCCRADEVRLGRSGWSSSRGFC